MKTYHEALLATPALARIYENGRYPTVSEIERHSFLALRAANIYYPDHYFKNKRELCFSDMDNLTDLLWSSFREASQPLIFNGNKFTVATDQFTNWQESLTVLPALPFLVFALFDKKKEDSKNQVKSGLFERSLLPCIKHPLLDEMIRDKGLCETHIHLNGTSEVDRVWQDALLSPRRVYSDLKKGLKKEEVRELYDQLEPGLDDRALFKAFQMGKALRDWILERIKGRNGVSLKKLLAGNIPEKSWQRHPLDGQYQGVQDSVSLEAMWWLEVFGYLERCRALAQSSRGVAQAVHAYHLCQSLFVQFLTQQHTQKGFDQFQKITLNEGREYTELGYQQRYRQLEGHYQQDLVFLEGRFAPKDKPQKMVRLLRAIIEDYEYYISGKKSNLLKDKAPLESPSGNRRMRLRLVAHFIKQKDDKSPHYLSLRRRLERTARILIHLRDRIPRLKEYLTGADAASNELHTPPEVFAPIFRRLRRAGWRYFTYHVGEDYVHLASGLRAMYEAVTFLELADGDRIGHGTAAGIKPELWLERLPPKIVISQGEWLDNLVFAYHLIMDGSDGEMHRYGERIRVNATGLARKLYATSPSMDLLMAAWKMRRLDLLAVLFPDNKHDELSLISGHEWEEAAKGRSKDQDAYKLLKQYFRHEGDWRKMIEVDIDAIFDKTLLTYLQQQVIKKLNTKMVPIEVMPTSNLRIAPYRDYGEHHIFRWLGLEDSTEPRPTVILATDNPGIFASNLRNEYAHILGVLVKKWGMEHNQAMRYLKEINDNTHAFRFEPDHQS